MPAPVELKDTRFRLYKALRAYFRLESNGNDETANAYNLTEAGSPAHSAAKFGNGLDLGTSNASKKATVANNLGITTGPITVVGWLKVLTEIGSGYYDLFYHMAATGNITNRIWYEYNGGTRRLVFNRDRLGTGSDTVNYTITLGTTATRHLALTYDGATIRAYVDGLLVGSIASSGSGASGGSNFFGLGVNAGGSSNYSSALFDDVAVFAQHLTADDVYELATGYAVVTKYEGSNDDYENSGTNGTAGQSVTPMGDCSSTGVDIYGSRGNGATGTFKIELKTGSVTGTVVATTGTLNTSQLTAYGSPAWNRFDWQTPVTLAAGTTYYIVMTALSGSATDEFRWSVDTTSPAYAGGTSWNGTTQGTGRDRNFRLLGTFTGTLDKANIVWWYDLDEGTGTSIDEENGGTDGSLNASAGWTSGGLDDIGGANALNLPAGINQNFAVTGPQIPNQVAFAVWGWFYHAGDASNRHLVGNRGTTGDRGVNIYKDTADKIVARVALLGTGNDFSITGNTAGDVGNSAWHLVLFQRDASGNAELFIDNVSQGTALSANALTAALTHLGNYNNAHQASDYAFGGKMQGWGWAKGPLTLSERSLL